MQVKPASIPGSFQIYPRIMRDARGSFVKTFHAEVFRKFRLETRFVEEYYSVSRRGVLRGLHFQVPPADHVKLVYCVQGEVVDAVVDMRVDSPSYGKAQTFTLNADEGTVVYVPKGLAHGFCVTSESAILVYKTTTVYSPENDTGIHWNSVGIPWPVDEPIVSPRDETFAALDDFASPFTYEP